jgi:fatty acid synthase
VNFNIENSSLPEGYHLVVVENTQFEVSFLSKIAAALAPRGFVLLVENTSIVLSATLKESNLQKVAVIENNNKNYFLLKKVSRHF